MSHVIPIIDLAPALNGGAQARREVAAEIDRTCREIGFFTICGHGVDPALIDELRKADAADGDLVFSDALVSALGAGGTGTSAGTSAGAGA